MGSILKDTGKTLIERLEYENPYFHLTIQPLFVENINIYFPSMLLQDIFLDIVSITGLEKLSLNDLIFNDNVIGVDKSSGYNFLACPDKLIDLYKKGCEHQDSLHLKNMFMSDFCNNGFESAPNYCYDIELIRSPQTLLIGEESSNAPIDMTIFFATINREASYGVGKKGLQKIEAFLEVRDNNNPNRFTQFVINEVSRDKNDTAKGHFLISLKTSTNDELEHHVWLFPDMPRKYALGLPGLFKKKLLEEDSAEKPVFEWVEDICRNNNIGINAFTNRPDYLAEKDSGLVANILSGDEAKYYAKTIPEIVNRSRRIYVPKDIATQIEQLYSHLLIEKKIIKYNPDLEKRSNNTLLELDMSCYYDIIKEMYNNMNTGDASKQDYNLFYRNEQGKLRFSTLYYSAQSGCLDPKKKQYAVFQVYVHRPSSSSDIEEFESFLNVINLDDPSNMFLFKIDELSKKSSTQKSAQKELYMTESFNYGNIFEHHIVIQKAYPEIAIDMPLKIRTALGYNQYTLAPKHREICAML